MGCQAVTPKPAGAPGSPGVGKNGAPCPHPPAGFGPQKDPGPRGWVCCACARLPVFQDVGLLGAITDPIHTPVTLFWPSDQALQALPREQQDFLFNQDNKDRLKEYLKFHVIREAKVFCFHADVSAGVPKGGWSKPGMVSVSPAWQCEGRLSIPSLPPVSSTAPPPPACQAWSVSPTYHSFFSNLHQHPGASFLCCRSVSSAPVHMQNGYWKEFPSFSGWTHSPPSSKMSRQRADPPRCGDS